MSSSADARVPRHALQAFQAKPFLCIILIKQVQPTATGGFHQGNRIMTLENGSLEGHYVPELFECSACLLLLASMRAHQVEEAFPALSILLPPGPGGAGIMTRW